MILEHLASMSKARCEKYKNEPGWFSQVIYHQKENTLTVKMSQSDITFFYRVVESHSGKGIDVTRWDNATGSCTQSIANNAGFNFFILDLIRVTTMLNIYKTPTELHYERIKKGYSFVDTLNTKDNPLENPQWEA